MCWYQIKAYKCGHKSPIDIYKECDDLQVLEDPKQRVAERCKKSDEHDTYLIWRDLKYCCSEHCCRVGIQRRLQINDRMATYFQGWQIYEAPPNAYRSNTEKGKAKQEHSKCAGGPPFRGTIPVTGPLAGLAPTGRSNDLDRGIMAQRRKHEEESMVLNSHRPGPPPLVDPVVSPIPENARRAPPGSEGIGGLAGWPGRGGRGGHGGSGTRGGRGG